MNKTNTTSLSPSPACYFIRTYFKDGDTSQSVIPQTSEQACNRANRLENENPLIDYVEIWSQDELDAEHTN